MTLSLVLSLECIYVNTCLNFLLFCLRKDQYLINSQSSLLRKIKLFNNNVNKKKKHARKFDVRSHVIQELREIVF